MSIRKKFDITTKKFYLVFDDNKNTTDKDVYTELFNGSISDCLGFKSYPMVMYAGKAMKHLQRTIDLAASNIEEPFFSPDGDKKTIASCSVALNNLKKYNYYDLVGVYQVHSVYKVVDYKRVSDLVQKECGYRFLEIPKELYIKLSVVENIRANREENKRKAKEKKEFLEEAEKIISTVRYPAETVDASEVKSQYTLMLILGWVFTASVIGYLFYTHANLSSIILFVIPSVYLLALDEDRRSNVFAGVLSLIVMLLTVCFQGDIDALNNKIEKSYQESQAGKQSKHREEIEIILI